MKHRVNDTAEATRIDTSPESMDEQRERVLKEDQDKYKYLEYLYKYKYEITQRLELSIHKTFSPTFSKIHETQTLLSESMQKLVHRCDAQYSDLTNRHRLLSKSIQDTTPVANPFNLHLPTPNPPNILIPEYSPLSPDTPNDLKSIIGNVQDISDPSNSKENIWRQIFRMDNRVIPPFDTDPPSLEKLTDSNEALLNICIRCVRQLKNTSKQTPAIPVTPATIDTNNPILSGFQLLAKEFKTGQQTIVKAISEDKSKKSKHFDKVKKPAEISTMCKVHGSLGVICEGLEDFTKSACDEEKRLLLNENDWKLMRDGLKQLAKIMERIPIFDQRQLNSVQSAIGCGSGSADINAILRDFNVFPKGTWKQNNNWQQWNNNADQAEETEQQPQGNQYKGYQGKKWNNQQQLPQVSTHTHPQTTTPCTLPIPPIIHYPTPITNFSQHLYSSEIKRKQLSSTRYCSDTLENNNNTHRTTHIIAPHTKLLNPPVVLVGDDYTYKFKTPVDLAAPNNIYINELSKVPVVLDPPKLNSKILNEYPPMNLHNISSNIINQYYNKTQNNDVTNNTYNTKPILDNNSLESNSIDSQLNCDNNSFIHNLDTNLVRNYNITSNSEGEYMNLHSLEKINRYYPPKYEGDSELLQQENINLNNLLKSTHLNIDTLANRKKLASQTLPKLEELSSIDTLDQHQNHVIHDSTNHFDISEFLSKIHNSIQHTFHSLDTSSTALQTLAKSHRAKFIQPSHFDLIFSKLSNTVRFL
eukprot:GHVR01182502.1.p1 GENE.GHVR01182502.1~~GHVR01182502.1.p1  ORF type:complete len:755 (+),score=69.45 GHVR01182502.1:824-3088(+)